MQSVVTVTISPAIDLSTSVEKVTPVHKLRCSPAQHDPGGGGINAARVVHKLGGDVRAIYPVGGATGQWLRRILENEGVPGLTFPVQAETRVDFTVLGRETSDEFRFVLPGPPLTETEWKNCIELIRELPTPPGYLVLSGSLPPGVPDDFYARIARMMKGSGVRLVLDTSGAGLAAGLGEGMYLIKPNLRELRDLTGLSLADEESWLAACWRLIDAGSAQIVALTLGDQGALLVTGGAAYRAQALPVEAVSSVGAGDSFLGAMIWALASGKALPDAFRFGMAAGSAALMTPGTKLCNRPDVERLYGEVIMHQI